MAGIEDEDEDGVPPHSTIITALRLAGRRGEGRPVGTMDLLIAVMNSDMSGQWQRIWLESGSVEAIAARSTHDPDPWPDDIWHGVTLTHTCMVAVEASSLLAARYRLVPMPVGVLVLGLLADPDCAAAGALGEPVDRQTLLDLVQDAILGVRLRYLETVLPETLAEAREALEPLTPAMPPVTDHGRGWAIALIAFALGVLVGVAYTVAVMTPH